VISGRGKGEESSSLSSAKVLPFSPATERKSTIKLQRDECRHLLKAGPHPSESGKENSLESEDVLD